MKRLVLAAALLVAAALAAALLVRSAAPGAPDATEAIEQASAISRGRAAATRRASPPRLSAAFARLSGRVVDHQGRPATGATVSAEGPSRAVVQVGDDGTFDLSGLAPGSYLLNASLDVRASERLGPVPLSPGEELRDLVLVLEMGAALSGTIRDSRDGAPIPGAAVWAAASSAVADDQGRYRLTGLPAGLIPVSASAEGFAPRQAEVELVAGRERTGADLFLERGARVYGTVFAGDLPIAGVEVFSSRYGFGKLGEANLAAVGVSDGEGRFAGTVAPGRLQLVARASGFAEARTEELEIAAGEEREVNLTLGLGASIVGAVRDASGAAASGCRVQAFDAVHGRTMAEAASDASGQFWLGGLPPAIYSVVASCAAGRAEASGISVAPGAETRVDLALGGGAIAGRVVDPSGAPVSGATVTVRVDGSAAPETLAGVTGPDGAFAVQGLAGERFVVQATAAAGRAERVGVPAGTMDLLLTLSSSALSGRVLGERGEPVSDFVVYAEPTSIGEGRPRSQRFLSPSGEFTLPLPAGEYTVRVGAPGYGPATLTEVRVSESGGFVRVELTRGGTVRGQVVDTNGRPIAGAMVASSWHMLHPYGRAAAVPSGVYGLSGPSGEFELKGVAAGNRVWIVARKDGYERSHARPISVLPGQEVSGVLLRLRPSTRDEGEPEFGGIGMSLTIRDGKVLVADAFQGGPARDAGLRRGDEIVAIEGTSVAGQPLHEVVSWIRGKVGTTVQLTVRRDGRSFLVSVPRVSVKL